MITMLMILVLMFTCWSFKLLAWIYLCGYTVVFQFHGMSGLLMTTFMLNLKSLIFSLTLLMIATSVLPFAHTYMRHSMYKSWFFLLYSLFVLSMLMFINAASLSSIFIGWEGLGMTSYVLIMFNHNTNASSSALITMLTSRLGDLCIMISIVLTSTGSSTQGLCVSWLIVIAAMTKSAVFPFSAWLPAAMAAPTPISSLVHSSTLVTAGIFLLIRFSHWIHSSTLNILNMLCIMTSVMAAMAAMTEVNLKKMIALSTLSQCSVMLISISNHMICAAYTHLLCHALFKSSIFLLMGNNMLLNESAQDSRVMSNSIAAHPLFTQLIIMNLLTMSAIPFSSGFYSKEPILLSHLTQTENFSMYNLTMLLSPLTTLLYSIRLMYLTSAFPHKLNPLKEETSDYLTAPIFALTAVSMISSLSLSFYTSQNFFTEQILLSKKISLILYPILSAFVVIYHPSPKNNLTSKLIFTNHYLSAKLSIYLPQFACSVHNSLEMMSVPLIINHLLFPATALTSLETENMPVKASAIWSILLALLLLIV